MKNADTENKFKNYNNTDTKKTFSFLWNIFKRYIIYVRRIILNENDITSPNYCIVYCKTAGKQKASCFNFYT